MRWIKLGKDPARKLLEKPPGMPAVTAILSAVAGLALGQEVDELSLGTLFLLYALAYMFYRLGGILDKPLFTPLYGTEKDRGRVNRVWRWLTPGFLFPIRLLVDFLPPTAQLESSRQLAAKALGSKPTDDVAVYDTEGIYGAAKHLFVGSSEWNDRVKPVLSISKASRAMILPFLMASVIGFTGIGPVLPFWPDANGNSLEVLVNPWVALFLATAAIFIFIYFRVWHMVALYDLVVPFKTFFFVSDSFRPQRKDGVITLLEDNPRLLVSSGDQLKDMTSIEFCSSLKELAYTAQRSSR